MDEYFTKTAALLLRFRAEIYDARPRPSLEQVVKIAYKATKVVQGHAEKMARMHAQAKEQEARAERQAARADAVALHRFEREPN